VIIFLFVAPMAIPQMAKGLKRKKNISNT
jgi:hypothetical protein